MAQIGYCKTLGHWEQHEQGPECKEWQADPHTSRPPTLDEYRAQVKPGKELCRWCGVQLPQTVLYYPHDGGWPVAGIAGLQWLYLKCVNCDYEHALWKLGVPRRAN